MAPPNGIVDGDNNLMGDQDEASSMDDNHPPSPRNNRRRHIQSGSDSSDTSSDMSSDNEQGDHSRRSTVEIGSDLYNHLVNGNKQLISTLETNLWELEAKEDMNSVLHIAASAGQGELITDMLPHCKNIIWWENNKGDLAFHSAAKAGHLNALKALTDWGKYDNSIRDKIQMEILSQENDEGDTALHIAVRNNQEKIALHLVEKYGQASYILNEDNISPLYLAIEGGYTELAEKMISVKHEKPAAEKPLLGCKSVAHAAIEAKNKGILKMILSSHEYLVESYDKKGRTPLSYATYIGYLEGVQYLLDEFPNCAFKCNKDGSFPIHNAASGGHIKVMKTLHMNSSRLLNRKSQNIFHVAAKSGKSKLVSYLLKVQEVERLINLKDEDGNTPLHLAAKGLHPRVVFNLTRDEKVNIKLQNNNGLTALDLVELDGGSSASTLEERLTWLALRYVNAPRSSQATRKSFVRNKSGENRERDNSNGSTMNGKLTKKMILKEELENFKSRIDTLLLVATLVATMTFAAGFTLPGGYFQDDPHIGLAVLAHKWALEVFVICDTAAMYGSILAVVTLIWGQVGELKLSVASLRLALPVLGFALSMMSVAFMMGLFVVLKNLPWLSYVVLGMGSISMIAVLVLFIPLYNPPYIRNPIARFFFSGPLFLLILVSEKCEIDQYD